MNIIVRPAECNSCYCRPDTTWERENKDFYCPDSIDVLEWTPVIFARVSKAGKCISRKFVERYYDAFNFGALIYTGKEEIAFTSLADHTSLLPFPLYNTIVMENEENVYEVRRNDELIFSTTDLGETNGELKQKLEESICIASQMTSLRIGDFVALELCSRKRLASKDDETVRLSSEFCGNELYNKKLIF